MAATIAPGHRRGLDGRRRRGGWRPARLGDITILVPARTSLPFLEDAFDGAGIPFRAESQLARLRHPGGARPAHGAAGRRRPDRPPPDRGRPAHAAARLRRRRPVPLQDRAGRPLELPGRPAGHGAGRRSGRGRAGLPAAASTSGGSGWRRPSCSTASPVTAGPSSWASPNGGPRDVWRRLRFVIDQARAWTRGDRRQPAPVPPLGRAADRRRGPGRRVGPARDRRRRRADHDHPRRQGPGVSRSPSCRACPPRPRPRRHRPRWSFPPTGDVGYRFGGEVHDRGVRGLGADRRADGLRRADPAAVRGLHPGPRPPGRVAAPQGSEQADPTARQPDQRRAARRRHGPRCSTTCPMPATCRSGAMTAPVRRPAPAPRRRRSTTGRPSGRRRLARQRPPDRGGGHRPHDEGRPDAEQRTGRRAAEAAARPRPSAVAQGPLRHRGRPGRPRRAADHRPGHAAPAWTPRSRPSARPKPSPTGPTTCAAWSGYALGVTVGAGGRRTVRTGGRSTPARRSRAAGCSRATSTCSTEARTAWSSSTTRRRPEVIRSRSTGGSRATASRARPHAGRRRRDRRDRRAGHVRVPHPRRRGRARPARLGAGGRRGWGVGDAGAGGIGRSRAWVSRPRAARIGPERPIGLDRDRSSRIDPDRSRVPPANAIRPADWPGR